MDKYLRMFKPAMTKWLRDHYPLEEAKKRWKKTVYLDGKWIRETAVPWFWCIDCRRPSGYPDGNRRIQEEQKASCCHAGRVRLVYDLCRAAIRRL